MCFIHALKEKERHTQSNTTKKEVQINKNGSLIWNWMRCDAVHGSIVAMTFTRLGLTNFCHPKGDTFNCCAEVSDALGSDINCFHIFSNFRRVIISNGVWTKFSQAFRYAEILRYTVPGSLTDWQPFVSVCEVVSFMRNSILVGQLIVSRISHFFTIKYRRALKMKTFAIHFRISLFFAIFAQISRLLF